MSGSLPARVVAQAGPPHAGESWDAYLARCRALAPHAARGARGTSAGPPDTGTSCRVASPARTEAIYRHPGGLRGAPEPDSGPWYPPGWSARVRAAVPLLPRGQASALMAGGAQLLPGYDTWRRRAADDLAALGERERPVRPRSSRALAWGPSRLVPFRVGSRHLAEAARVSRSTWQRAVRDLEQLGYLRVEKARRLPRPWYWRRGRYVPRWPAGYCPPADRVRVSAWAMLTASGVRWRGASRVCRRGWLAIAAAIRRALDGAPPPPGNRPPRTAPRHWLTPAPRPAHDRPPLNGP